MKSDEELESLGRIAISEALRLWKIDIYDPPRSDKTVAGMASKSHIDSFIRGGLGWTWEPAYAGDGSFEWCGAFAAHCWSAVRTALRKTYFASTYRLDRYARYQSVNGEVNKGAGRLIASLDEHSNVTPWEPRAGDILIIGPPGSGFGKHITLVESFDGEVFSTVEGNGTGLGPHGEHQQGVVRAKRTLGGSGWHARRLIRPSGEDID